MANTGVGWPILMIFTSAPDNAHQSPPAAVDEIYARHPFIRRSVCVFFLTHLHRNACQYLIVIFVTIGHLCYSRLNSIGRDRAGSQTAAGLIYHFLRRHFIIIGSNPL